MVKTSSVVKTSSLKQRVCKVPKVYIEYSSLHIKITYLKKLIMVISDRLIGSLVSSKKSVSNLLKPFQGEAVGSVCLSLMELELAPSPMLHIKIRGEVFAFNKTGLRKKSKKSLAH